jgi:hypothetical protein
MKSVAALDWIPASRKRVLLAAYLDFLLIGAPLTVGLWTLTGHWPALQSASFPIRVLVFFLIESILLAKVRWSPGFSALGMAVSARSPDSFPSDPQRLKPVHVVDRWLIRNERWWTVLFGVLLILDGVKGVVRWTMWHVPMPFMGVQVSMATSLAITVAMGCAAVALGAGILRLRTFSVPLGLSYYGINLLSFLMSWSLLPGWIAEYTMARRAHRGLSPRPGEIEFMQTWIPAGSVVLLAMGLFLVVLVRRRILSAKG